ncbi:16509_t:CDS:2, partial [Funneliformis geosporum]
KKYLTGIPTRNNIVAENNEGLTAILDNALSSHQEIPFIVIDNEGSSEKINGKYRYVLRLYGSLINNQKVMVTLSGIPIFFDILVPDGKCLDECETKVRDILFSEVETLKIEHIKAFPFQENNFKTASNDLYSFHQKVAQENGIQLSGLSMLMEDFTTIKLGEFAEVLDLNQNVFMICMTLYWKDDLKPLKLICLVNVEIEPNSRWIIIICGNQQMTGKFEIKEEIIKWKYHEKIEAKSENALRQSLLSSLLRKLHTDDIWVCLKKCFPHSEVEKEGSLKYFLQKCNLDSKADMPYDKMWKIYLEAKKSSFSSTARKMCEIANYCIINALRCQELLIKLSVINDYREVASIAYVSLSNTHYYVNRMKVRNLLGAYAIKRNIVFSTRVCENIEKGKYPDAYVFFA